MTAPEQSSPSLSTRRLRFLLQSGGLILLSLCAIFLFVDWRAGTQLTRPWLQGGFAALAFLIFGSVIVLPTLSRSRRIVLTGVALLILLAVLDSLDGQQDILTSTVVALLLLASAFAAFSLQLLHSATFSVRRKIATSIALLTTIAYLGSACYYVLLNLTLGPQNTEHSVLIGCAFLLNMLIRWLGELTPNPVPLTGAVRVCPACGLRNIAERQTCNRCSSRLGSIERDVERSTSD